MSSKSEGAWKASRRGRLAVATSAALGICVLAGSAAAGPLDRTKVPADANVVVHLDVEAALASSVGKVVVANRAKLDIDGLDDLKGMGVDPLADFKSVTVIAPDAGGKHGVVILRTTPAVDGIVNHLKADPKTRTLDVGGQSIMSWEDHGKKQYAQVRPTDNAGSRLVFISDDWDVLSRVLQVADGKAASLPSDAGTSPRPSEGSFFFIHARTLPDDMRNSADRNASALLVDVGAAWLDMGQRAETGYAAATIEFNSPESAKNIMQMAQGFIAFAKMMSQNEPDLAEVRSVLDAVSLTATEQRLTARIERDAASLAKAVEGMIEHEHDDDDVDDDNNDDDDKKAPAKPQPASTKPGG